MEQYGAGRTEDCSGRTGAYKYVTGVVLVVGPWGLDEWANWKEFCGSIVYAVQDQM